MATSKVNQLTRFQNLFSGLRGTLLLAFGLISIVSVGLVATVGILLGTNIAQSLVFDELVTEVELNEEAINNWLDERTHDLAVIINNPRDLEEARQIVLNEDVEAYESFLSRLEIETGPANRFIELFLVDLSGEIILTTDEINLGIEVQDMEYFQSGLLAPYISHPIFNPNLGQNEIIITVPVRDELGGVIGILAGRLDLSEITDIILSGARLTETGQVYLVSQDYRFLTEPRFAPTLGEARSLAIDRALTPGPTRNGQAIYENYNGTLVVGAYRWIPDLEVVLLAERAEEEALAGIRQLEIFSIGIAIFVLLVAIGVALYITARIVNPITMLTEATVAVSQGDLGREVQVQARNEIGILANAFNTMTQQIRELIESIQERTRALETSAVITRQLTTRLELDDLLKEVVDNIKEAFDFYHVHLYLLDPRTNDLMMREGSGEVGQKLKAKGHKIKFGQGIVGGVAKRGEAILVKNVEEYPGFLRNPDLPETQSELAIPLRKGDEVLGVLDMQSTEIGGFDENDMALMQSIAGQIAVALDNARLFREARAAAAEAEALNRRLIRESWQDIGKKVESSNYIFSSGEVASGSSVEAWLPAMEAAVRQKNLTQLTASEEKEPQNGTASVAIPLTLRGQVIGVIGIERESDQQWNVDELTTIRSIAGQVALALESGRLARETELRATREQIIANLTQSVWAANDVELILRESVNRLGETFKASKVVLRLGSEQMLKGAKENGN